MHLETNAGYESIPNRTFSRVENGISLKNKALGNKTKEAIKKIFLSTRTIG